MKRITASLCILFFQAAFGAADSASEVLTFASIESHMVSALEKNNVDDAVKWYLMLDRMIVTDWALLANHGISIAVWNERSSQHQSVLQKKLPNACIVRLLMDGTRIKEAESALLEKIKADQVAFDYAAWLGGSALPFSDAELKDARIKAFTKPVSIKAHGIDDGNEPAQKRIKLDW